MRKAKAKPESNAIWDVVRQLGQGGLTVVSVGRTEPATSPTNLPGELTPQAVLAIGSEKGPLLAAFTFSNVASMLPADGPADYSEQQLPALELVKLASGEPYAGLALNPGTAEGIVIPGPLLAAGLPAGRTNFRAKSLINAVTVQSQTGKPADDMRQALMTALASGPVYTAAEKASLDSGNEPKFPLLPMGGKTEPGQPVSPDTPAAVLFGTSPAEIAAVFGAEDWVPVPVRMVDVVKAVQKNHAVSTVVVNPMGPTLQMPVEAEPTPEPAETQDSEVGAATEPDGGTREGED
jgi:hypothetical protein